MSHSRPRVYRSRLAHRIEGDGPNLLLLHGWGITYGVWQNLVPLLRPHFQLTMVELPGNGASPALAPGMPYYSGCADALDELREDLGIDNWAILAYSAGTRAGEAYIQKYAEHVTSAVFLCPINIRRWCYNCITLQWWLERLAPPVANWILSGPRLHFILRVLGFNGRRHEYIAMWQGEIELQVLGNIKPMLYDLPGRGRAPYAIPAARTLFVWGSRDVLSRPPQPVGPNDVVFAATHSAPLLEAPQVAELVLRFLDEGQERAS
jgi:pimeloyl-ACP methyl ester carboxylesterase